MKRQLIIALSTSVIALPLAADPQPSPAPAGAVLHAPSPSPAVQVALLLDTSSSMEGLIAQAQAQLWEVVNTFNGSHQKGRDTTIEVALYEYGNSGLQDTATWIRQVHPFTRDLDSISESLFALRTNGGEEFCGAVIQRALTDLQWSTSPDTCRVVFIAGNEPFTQGQVDASKACLLAKDKNIHVNTLHCGDSQTGISGGWNAGALLAAGKYFAINHNRVVAEVPAPQDAEIARLNASLNTTYIAYGQLGAEGKARQAVQDGNAEKARTWQSRAAAKASGNYSNGHWDLVDACARKDFDLSTVAEAELPPEMRSMTPEQRRTHIAVKAAERAAILKRLRELLAERAQWLEANARSKTDDSLGSSIRGALREQAGAKGITWQ